MTSARLDAYLSAPNTREFIRIAKERGHATTDELRLYLPMNVTEEEMDVAVAILTEIGVTVRGDSRPLRPGGPVSQLRKLVGRLRDTHRCDVDDAQRR